MQRDGGCRAPPTLISLTAGFRGSACRELAAAASRTTWPTPGSTRTEATSRSTSLSAATATEPRAPQLRLLPLRPLQRREERVRRRRDVVIAAVTRDNGETVEGCLYMYALFACFC
ncbi:hypothetical protein BRADI_1g42756v3 [Brachypodium distachyon]|uniref:Uncharacterized protein n=1 Tax=Brachypodium distachyon TaxID=15368 RepID=A0A0Q3L5K4_BRADI|nr:hypothetical protein BRADI_1g42756v3 [Brachypodium distachyon]